MRTTDKVFLTLALVCGVQWVSFVACIAWPAVGFSPRATTPLVTLDVLSCIGAFIGLLVFMSASKTGIARGCFAIFLLHFPIIFLECVLAAGAIGNALT